LDTVS